MSDHHPNGSETQEGPDWWMASDSRWYPPELHPEFRHGRSVVIGEGSDTDEPDVSVEPTSAPTESAIPGLLGGASATAAVEPTDVGAGGDDFGGTDDGANEIESSTEDDPESDASREDRADIDAVGAEPDVGHPVPDGEIDRTAISLGSSIDAGETPEAPQSYTAPSNTNAVFNPWNLPVRGHGGNDTAIADSAERESDPEPDHRIILPGQLEPEAAPRSLRPSGPTPVAKSITFRPAEPTTVQAAVNVPDDTTPWYERSVDGTESTTASTGHTPNIYGGALSVAGGAFAIVGALMTWATESGPLLDGFLWARKVPGFASNGGWVLVCGVLMGVAGVLSIIGIKPIGVWSIMSVVAGTMVLAAVLYSYTDIVGSASDDWRTFVSASTGIDAVTLKARGVGLRPAFGLWLSSFAGVLGCAAGIYFKRDF